MLEREKGEADGDGDEADGEADGEGEPPPSSSGWRRRLRLQTRHLRTMPPRDCERGTDGQVPDGADCTCEVQRYRCSYGTSATLAEGGKSGSAVTKPAQHLILVDVCRRRLFATRLLDPNPREGCGHFLLVADRSGRGVLERFHLRDLPVEQKSSGNSSLELLSKCTFDIYA